MKIKLISISFFLTSFLYSNSVLSWGKMGHRVAGAVATKYLEFKSESKINKILGADTLSDASIWADLIRSSDNKEYRKFLPWHYATIPNGTTYDALPVKEEGDVFIGIKHLYQELKSLPFEEMMKTKKTQKKIRQKLKLLIHLVEDLHQPLHIGNGEDKGGNLCRVKYFGKAKSLHTVWDTLMIEREGFSYTEFKDYLIAHYSKKYSSAKKSFKVDDVKKWMKESYKIRQTIYPKSLNEKKRSYCANSLESIEQLRKLPSLSYKYDYRFMPILKERLFLSGYRVSLILNSLFSK